MRRSIFRMVSILFSKICQWRDSVCKAFRSASFADKGSMIAFALLCLFVFDCSFSGSGHLFAIGPLSLRMVLGFCSLVFTLPKLFSERRKYLKNPLLWMFLIFLVWLGICAVRGYFAGNRMNVLISDLKGFMWLFLVPVAVVNINTKARMDRVLDFLLVGAVVQGVLVLLINALCSVWYDTISPLYSFLGATQFGILDVISINLFRVFSRSCPYLVIACGVAIYRQISEKRIRIRYLATVAICLNAAILSYTRSVYGCVFVCLAGCFVGLLVLYREKLLSQLKFLGVAVCVTLAFLFVLEFSFGGSYSSFAIARTFGRAPERSVAVLLRDKVVDLFDSPSADSPEHPGDSSGPTVDKDKQQQEELYRQEHYLEITNLSDALRGKTQAELKELIVRSPLIGNGLGASAPSRDDGLDEYFYLDMLARVGVLGLILYILPFGYIAVLCLRNFSRLKQNPSSVGLLCGMVALWAITWFNPWMNAVLGIACYALCSAIPNLICETESCNQTK